MDIIRLEGTDKKLYELVAPLVMNPAILRQNNGYPFKTSLRHVWYVALADGGVCGFLPVKQTDALHYIDNYYIRGDSAEVIDALLQRAADDRPEACTLSALVHTRHVADFRRNGFDTTKVWKNYEKMTYNTPPQP